MFGSKLRAWMDAVRPKKKQHRKEKQGKNTALSNNRPNPNNHTVTWKNTSLLDSEGKGGKQDPSVKYVKPHIEKSNEQSRYSATNLSSPESAYSTGYSTDGTSPGAPPDYLLNSSNKKSTDKRFENRLSSEPATQLPCSSKTIRSFPKAPSLQSSAVPQDNPKPKEYLEETEVASSSIFFGNIPEAASSGLVSPRQRNRIRTNPWLPGGTTSAVPSPLPVRQEVSVTPTALRAYRNSPIQHRYLSPATHRRSLSSSSCSSLSAGLNHSLEHHFPRSFSDEDDCTLNEMMGKYDESYVYEKETDILSDSDPTDCESDIDTGQDGGDEDDNADVELDFIDNCNGSYVEIESKINNTGHCIYFIPSDVQRKRSSRRRTTKKLKDPSEKKRKSGNSKKLYKHSVEKPRHWSLHQNGSKSAGATPISVRKSSLKPTHRVPEECLKKRSNSVCLQKNTSVLIDKRDREADLKYKELIGQAEQIIRTMNINGLSPRRLPGPTNKRVELLRSTECAKPEQLFKNKPTDETIPPNSNLHPSTAVFKNNRFSPKKNHITNFIINNSPVLVRKELQGHSPNTVRRCLAEESPLVIRKQKNPDEDMCQRPYPEESINHHAVQKLKKTVKEYHEVSFGTPTITRKNHQPKSILHRNDQGSASLLSPRHRRATEIPMGSSSSEEESLQRSKKKLSKSCPQSEPLRRKVYFGRNTISVARGHGKTVAFNLNNETPHPSISQENNMGSTESLRHQVLLNTIQCLKRNLEDQSASLQQTYTSTQNMYKY